MTWMDKASFERINKSYCSQATVWSRLAVALDRLGNYGNEASLNRSKRLWGGGGVGMGTADDYTDRVIIALGDLTPRYVRWLSPQERRKRLSA
ncbi:hypothetical protein GQ600_14293 [Phytophthora cactorum]|nr:hypothetical protein GQ600_14293 [Phytophthora cactorum]